jgi:hypothetical protein
MIQPNRARDVDGFRAVGRRKQHDERRDARGLRPEQLAGRWL